MLPKKVPAVDKPVGFDLMKGDWVAPYGAGDTADFVFKLQGRITSLDDFDATMTLTFSNPDDGIQSVYAQPRKGSYLRLPPMAPEEGYQGSLVRRTYRNSPETPIYMEKREDQNYFFRVRTKKDETGRIVSALYGKIHGEIEWWQRGEIKFVYYLNPKPNSRNVEFDPRQNLFKRLSSLGQVRDP